MAPTLIQTPPLILTNVREAKWMAKPLESSADHFQLNQPLLWYKQATCSPGMRKANGFRGNGEIVWETVLIKYIGLFKMLQ